MKISFGDFLATMAAKPQSVTPTDLRPVTFKPFAGGVIIPSRDGNGGDEYAIVFTKEEAVALSDINPSINVFALEIGPDSKATPDSITKLNASDVYAAFPATSAGDNMSNGILFYAPDAIRMRPDTCWCDWSSQNPPTVPVVAPIVPIIVPVVDADNGATALKAALAARAARNAAKNNKNNEVTA
jgi:hypothetical protein